MATKKNVLTTAAGIAEWPKVTVPDTKFDEAGVLSTKLKLSGADAVTQRELVDAAMVQSLADAKADKANAKKKVKQADPPYSENEDGSISFTFKRKASGVSKKTGEPWKARIALFDKYGKPLPQDVKIGGGSTIKCAYELLPFYTALVGAGISLRLQAVQVLNLVEFGGDASYFGFGAEEAAAEADEEDEPTSVAVTESTTDF